MSKRTTKTKAKLDIMHLYGLYSVSQLYYMFTMCSIKYLSLPVFSYLNNIWSKSIRVPKQDKSIISKDFSQFWDVTTKKILI